MANETLNSLLKEYEQKKLNAELDLDRKKENLYKNNKISFNILCICNI